MTTNKRGIELLQDPALNKSTASRAAEQQANDADSSLRPSRRS